jgi:hypothetical protein
MLFLLIFGAVLYAERGGREITMTAAVTDREVALRSPL